MAVRGDVGAALGYGFLGSLVHGVEAVRVDVLWADELAEACVFESFGDVVEFFVGGGGFTLSEVWCWAPFVCSLYVFRHVLLRGGEGVDHVRRDERCGWWWLRCREWRAEGECCLTSS